MVAKGIKGYQSERELGLLSFVALGTQKKKKVEEKEKSQRPLKLKMQTEM